MALEQLKSPKTDEEVVIISTNHGDIKLRLFPKVAPKAVENFKTHIENNYYDGVTFHRVMNEFMIQGGDPDGTGRGGESIWGKSFKDEFHPEYPLKMNSIQNIIILEVHYQWLIQDLIQMEVNFS